VTIYQHFREHEHPFVDRVLDWMINVKDNYSVYITDFLNPRERKIVATIIGTKNEEVKFSFFGGIDKAERQRAIIAPYFVEINEEDFEIVALEAKYASQFVTLSHRDVLGAFTSLGIERKMVGDIIVQDGTIQLITTKAFKPYIIQQLTKIKRTSVSFKEIPFNLLEKIDEEWIQRKYTVSSLRLDVVLKSVFHLSRNHATKLINSEKVSVNFSVETDQTTLLEEDDLISARGYGRCKIESINGITKKDKIRIVVSHLS
jgi:RNA-binding protein YlmH